MKQKTPVTQRALIQRLNRVLAKQNEMLRYNRAAGVYMRVDIRRNVVLEDHTDLAALATKLNVLKPWEKPKP